MRRRLIIIAVLITALAAQAALAVGPATADVRSAGLPTAGAGVDPWPPQFEGAGLEDILRSLVSGDSPLITEVPPRQPISPFGAEVVDDSGDISITDEFEAIVNLQSFAISTDLDFDGTDDIITENGERNAGSPTLVRVTPDNGVPSSANELWGDYWRVFDKSQVPTFGGTFASSVDELITGLGIDVASDEPQEALGTHVTVARSMNPGPRPFGGGITIWGAHTAGNYGEGAPCRSSMYIYELGRAFQRAGSPSWIAPSLAPYDLFTDTSDALVIRCTSNGNGWYVDALSNNGSSFQPTTTNTTALVFSNGFIAFTPSGEFGRDIGYRSFAFKTPASGGYQPGNTFATTYPTFPALMAPIPRVLVGNPYPKIEYGPFPIQLDMTASSYAAGSDEESACGADWSALFEAYVMEGSTPDDMDVALYQFTSGQVTWGKITYSGLDFMMTTSGGGDTFTENFALEGSGGEYRFNPGELSCSYAVSAGSGMSEFMTALDELAPAEAAPSSTVSTATDAPASTIDESTSKGSTTKDDSTTRPETSDDDGGFPWGLTALLSGLALIVGGYFFSRTRENDGPTETPTTTKSTTTGSPIATTTGAEAEGPCDRLRRKYEEAKADAESKRTSADDAETSAEDAESEADDARSDADDADSDANDAKDDRQKAERNRDAPPPSEEESWIEDSETGERITGTDLRLRREAAGEAWDQYQSDPSQESAEQTESDWEALDAEGARAARREAWEADQAARAKALEEAQDAEEAANDAKREADEARDAANQKAKDAREEADRLDEEADDAEDRAAELKRMLDECLGLSTGSPTRWGGPIGLAEDSDGACYPDDNVERRVLDSFDKDVKVNWWVTVRPSSSGPQEARRIAGELRWWRDVFAGASSALNVAGAVKGLTTRTVDDALGAAASGATVIAGDEDALGIDIPTSLPQVPVVVLEGLAATSAALVDKWGEWITNNHVEMIAEFGFQVKHVKMTWVEMWKCENGVKKCAERVLEIDMGAIRTTGSVRTETFQPRERWQPRVDGLGRTIARQAQASSQEMVTFMGRFQAGPC